jgi:hypothetical protein
LVIPEVIPEAGNSKINEIFQDRTYLGIKALVSRNDDQGSFLLDK